MRHFRTNWEGLRISWCDPCFWGWSALSGTQGAPVVLTSTRRSLHISRLWILVFEVNNFSTSFPKHHLHHLHVIMSVMLMIKILLVLRRPCPSRHYNVKMFLGGHAFQVWDKIQNNIMSFVVHLNALPCPSEPQHDMVEHRRSCPSRHYFML